MTTVAEEGNRRIGDMTHTEVEQCVLDIKTWFERKGNADFSPASASGDITHCACP